MRVTPRPAGKALRIQRGAENKHLLTPKQATWGLTGCKDFIRGKHYGTDVTSKGNLVIAPAVRSIYQTTEMLPWKIASAGKNIYLCGWNSNQVIHLDADNTSDVFSPKQEIKDVKTVTALTTDAAGNVLIATWPDQHVRLLSPDGAILHDWVLPGSSMIWDLAVASDGQRYAAGDGGMLYVLRDNEKPPVDSRASPVPDKHVYALTSGTHGEIYLATAPRGKVYRLSANGDLQAVYEARGMASSLAVDDADNVYVGTSPICRVYRISPDGTEQMIFHGAGRLNHTVSAMKFIGNTLYVATGPTGGIYRISNPAGQDPEATIIFAREDLRTGMDDKAFLGAESVFVNALAVADDGQLLAAASSPGQVVEAGNAHARDVSLATVAGPRSLEMGTTGCVDQCTGQARISRWKVAPAIPPSPMPPGASGKRSARIRRSSAAWSPARRPPMRNSAFA